jgi:hypothetical protein
LLVVVVEVVLHLLIQMVVEVVQEVIVHQDMDQVLYKDQCKN